MMSNAIANTDVNIVRLSRGQDFVRFEITRGDTWATMHNSKGDSAVIELSDARDRIGNLIAAGWSVKAV